MKRDIVVIGAGSHASVVIDLIEQSGRDRIVGLLDDTKTGFFDGHKIIGTTAILQELRHLHTEYFIVAVGNNKTRKDLYQKAIHWRLIPITVIHPSASISPKAIIGAGSVVMPHVVVNAHTEIGCNVILNTGCTVDHHNLIHDHVHLAPGVHLAGHVIVKADSLVPIGTAVPPGRRVSYDSAGQAIHY